MIEAGTVGVFGGTVGILNVGAGDTKLSFDPTNPAECIRAARIVTDMLRRGYALLVEVGKDADDRLVYQRATGFDEAKCEYIIADFDPVTAAEADQQEALENEHRGTAKPSATASREGGETKGKSKPPETRRRLRQRSIKASATSAVAVARSAGG